MKNKKKNIMLVLLILVIVIIALIVFGGVLKRDKNYVKIAELEDFENVGYIVIKYTSKTGEIIDKEIIGQIVNEIKNLDIKKAEVNYGINCNATGYYKKPGYTIIGYEDKSKGEAVFDIDFASGLLTLSGDEKYSSELSANLYDLVKETLDYCVVPLPQLLEGSILEYKCSDDWGELTKAEVYEKYCDIADSKPIEKTIFESNASDSYISIETVDNEFIDMYMVDDLVYTRYRIKQINRSYGVNGEPEYKWVKECYFLKSGFEETDLQKGEYYNSDKSSYVSINEDGTFEYKMHIAMGTVIKGKYSINGNELYLKSDVGEFEFSIKDKSIVFEEGNELTDSRIEKGTKYTLEN